ncbi:Branched-chain amino acid transport system substrate-binding protein OS=Castellaniella defragrans OX=75697 GN=HNR28_003409 PE=3 SV=1 [Castellaniella defragrans]
MRVQARHGSCCSVENREGGSSSLKHSVCLAVSTLVFATAGAQAAQDKNPIIIGAAISLTTEQAIAGQEQRAGILMAVNEINKAGGVPGKGGNRPVKVIFADNGDSPTKAVNALEDALSQHPVAVMLSIRGTHVLPQLPLLAREKVPGLTISATNALTKQGNPYIFRFYPNDAVTKPILTKYVSEKLKLTHPAIFYSSEDYGSSGRDAFLASLKAQGIEPVAVESHKPTDKDFTAQLLKFKSKHADVIYMQTQEAASALILKQAKRLRLGIPFALAVTSVGASALELVKPDEIAGSYAEAAVVDPNSSKNPDVRKWATAVHETLKVTPDYAAEIDYDATKMLLKAIELYGPDSAALTKGLHEMSYQGLISTYRSDKEGNMNHAASVIKITADKHQEEVFRSEVGFTPY